MTNLDKKEEKGIDVEQVVNYLNHAFTNAVQKVFGPRWILDTRAKAGTKGTLLYEYQIEHCYLIDEIQRGPVYMLPKVISDANENIAMLQQEEPKGSPQ